MMSSADLPACPACGSREVHGVRGPDDRVLYACRQCGRDQTQAWESVQPRKRPEPIPAIGPKAEEPDPHPLGVGATVRTES